MDNPKYLHRILQGLPVDHLVETLELHPHLWDQNKLRTTFENSPHAQVRDIWLRFNETPEPGQEATLLDKHESIDYPAYEQMPAFRSTVMNIFAYVGGERLGRVLVVKLPPGASITPHIDSGSHAVYYERFHLCLQAGPGCHFRVGEDWVEMKAGELWWMQNQIEHEVTNESDVDRIHLIVDAKCRNWVEAVYGA